MPLYRLEEATDQTPPESKLVDWLRRKDREDFGYSEILELKCSDGAGLLTDGRSPDTEPASLRA